MNCSLCLFDEAKCICEPSWMNFMDDFEKDIRNELSYVYTNSVISTITYNFKILYVNLDLKKLASSIKPSLFTRSFKFKENAKKSKDDPEANYQMYNSCIICGFIDRDDDPTEFVRVNIQVYHNGSFTITGCRTINNIIKVVKKLITLLMSFEGVIIKPDIAKLSGLRNVTIEEKPIENIKHIMYPVNEDNDDNKFKSRKKRKTRNNRKKSNDGNQEDEEEQIIYDFPESEKKKLFKNLKRVKILYNDGEYDYYDKVKNFGFEYEFMKIGTVNDVIIHENRISMINTNFSISKEIRQKNLSNLLKNDELSTENGGPIKNVEFNTDKYHGVKIKYVYNYSKNSEKYYTRKRIEKCAGELTISVFNTGKIIITGGRNPNEFNDAKCFLLRFMEKHKEDIFREGDVDAFQKKKGKSYKKVKIVKELNELIGKISLLKDNIDECQERENNKSDI